MPKQLQKTLQDYISKMKKTPTPQIHLPSKTLSSSASWILRGCKHSKTLSFAVGRNQKENHDNDDPATLSDIDRFMLENFKSLYQKDNDEQNGKKVGEEDDNYEEKSGGISCDSPRFIDPPPDLCGSHRFFVAPGSSGSLIEEAWTSATTSEDTGSSSATTTNTLVNDSTRLHNVDDRAKEAMSPDEFITVLTYSPSPYDDFRHSMQEMIEARLHNQGKVNWEFMEELLFCYLNLNDKKSYKYILSAFVDLVVVLRENSGRIPARPSKLKVTGGRKGEM